MRINIILNIRLTRSGLYRPKKWKLFVRGLNHAFLYMYTEFDILFDFCATIRVCALIVSIPAFLGFFYRFYRTRYSQIISIVHWIALNLPNILENHYFIAQTLKDELNFELCTFLTSIHTKLRFKPRTPMYGAISKNRLCIAHSYKQFSPTSKMQGGDSKNTK